MGQPAFVITFSLILTVLIILTLIGNALVCVSVCLSRNLRIKINYLIVSLAVSDILVAIIVMPMYMYYYVTNLRYLSEDGHMSFTRAVHFFDIFSAVASVINLTAIALERMWSVCSPLKHRQYLTTKTVSLVLVVVWAYALIVALIEQVTFGWDGAIALISALGYFTPLFLIVGSYSVILFKVWHSSRHVITKEDTNEITRTVIIVTSLYVFSWSPYQFATLCLTYNLEVHWFFAQHGYVTAILTLIRLSNSCCNPIVYAIANKQYRDGFKQSLRKMRLLIFGGRSPEDELTRLPLQENADAGGTINRQSPLPLPPLREEANSDPESLDHCAATYRHPNDYPQGDYRSMPDVLHGTPHGPGAFEFRRASGYSSISSDVPLVRFSITSDAKYGCVLDT